MGNTASSITATFDDDLLITESSVRQDYRYWRVRIMYSLIIGYAAFYLVRQNFTMALPALSAEFGYSKTQTGLIISAFSIIYGVGKFLNGYLSDRSNARYFMSIGLLVSAAISLLIGFSSGLLFIGVLWGINAWFQSMGWPPVARLLTHWYSPKELGTKWGLWNSSHQIGGAAISALAGYLIVAFGWRSAFFVPALLALGAGLFLLNRLRDTPQSLGLPPVEEYKGIVKTKKEEEEEFLTHGELIRRVLNNKLLWYVSFGNLFLYVVRMGVFNWAPTFLKELKGHELLTAGWQIAGFEIAGMAGGMAAGLISDKIFASRRGPVSTLYMFALIFSLFYFWKVPAGSRMMDTFAMFTVGFLVYGPQVLVGVAAADFATKKAAGLATGFTGTFGYIGASISGVGVGMIADKWGWDGGFIFFIVCAILGTGCFALTWRHRARVLEGKS